MKKLLWLMAGRAAVQWSGYPNAIEYFTGLTSDTNCPPDLWASAVLAYGGVRIRVETNRLAGYAAALQVYGQIHQRFTNSEYAALAWGEMGNCYLQLATVDPRNYEAASNAYQKVIAMPAAGVAARADQGEAVAASDHQQRRRQREGEGSGQRAAETRPLHPQPEHHLAAGGARQKLAERDQIAIGLFIEPFPVFDELGAKIADMGDRPAEAGQPEPQEDEKDRPGGRALRRDGLWSGDRGHRAVTRLSPPAASGAAR